MNQHPAYLSFERQWDGEDAARDTGTISETIVPGRTRKLNICADRGLLDEAVLSASWRRRIGRDISQVEHLGDQKLSRVAKVTSTAFTRQMTIDLTIQGARIFYRDTPYLFFTWRRSS